MSDDPIRCPECGAKPPYVIFHPDYKQSVEQGVRYKRRKCKECGATWDVVELTTERLHEIVTTIEEYEETMEQVRKMLERERVRRVKDARIALAAMQPVIESRMLEFKQPTMHGRLRQAADLLIHRNEEDNGL